MTTIRNFEDFDREFLTLPIREYVEEIIGSLEFVSPEAWAEAFVDARMEFQRLYGKGLIFSTSHGVNFFENVLACLDGAKWDEKGELGDNFRKMIKTYDKNR